MGFFLHLMASVTPIVALDVDQREASLCHSGLSALASPSVSAKNKTDLKIYLELVGRYPLFDSEQEIQLFSELENREIRLLALILSTDRGQEGLSDYLLALKDNRRIQKRAVQKALLQNSPLETQEVFSKALDRLKLGLFKLSAEDFINLSYEKKEVMIKAAEWARAGINEDYLSPFIHSGIRKATRVEGIEPDLLRAIQVQWERVDQIRHQLMEGNLRLVVSIVLNRYKQQATYFNVELMDVISEANFGLERTIGRFELKRGFRLSTAATWWILNALKQYFHGIRRALSIKTRSLDLPSKGPGKPTLVDILEDKKIIDPSEISINAEASQDLEKIFERAKLNEQEKTVLRYRYGLDLPEALTLEETGKRMGLSRERIRKIQKKASDKLKATGAG